MGRAGLDRDAVVAAAAALADADGLEALTLARLAATLGVRAPSLYAHVGGLADVRRRLAARGAQELAGRIQGAAAGRARRDALAAVAEAYVAFARERPGTYAAMQRAPAPGDPDGTAAAAALLDAVTSVLRGYGLEADDAVHAIRILRAALHGFVSLEAAGGFELPVDLDETFRRLVDLLDSGLSAK